MPSLIIQNKIAQKIAFYTRMVLLGRKLLWFLIILVIILVIYLASGSGSSDKTRLVFSDIKKTENLQNVMLNPDYHGFDDNNMPYRVLADEAVQSDSETVLLKNIRADMMNKENKWLAVNAGSGDLKNRTKTLTLTKGVDMFYEGGYEFHSEMTFVDIGKGSASGNKPVKGQGPTGTLSADRFSVYDRGNIMIFEGSVKMVLYRE